MKKTTRCEKCDKMLLEVMYPFVKTVKVPIVQEKDEEENYTPFEKIELKEWPKTKINIKCSRCKTINQFEI